jgi:UTP--glucose-1-phosphate uridylyltransferase
MTVNLAVIPVAGRGTRLLPVAKSQPKEMLPVGRKPVVQYVVEELARCGITRLLFITGPGKTAIENHFDVDDSLIANLRETGKEELLDELAFERDALEYFYTRQRRQLGLGHAVLCAEPMVGDDPFVVALGDSIIGLHAQSDVVRLMVDRFEQTGADAVIALEEVPDDEVSRYGIALPKGTPNDIFEIADLIEKPAIGQVDSNLAIAARYVFSPKLFDCLGRTDPGHGGEIQLTDAIRILLAEGGKVLGVRLSREQKRFDIGNFPSYFHAFLRFALSDPEYGEGLRESLQNYLEVQEIDLADDKGPSDEKGTP